MAVLYYRMLIYNTVAPSGGSLRWSRSTCVINNEDNGAMKAEGQARLEPPKNPCCASLDLRACPAGCREHMV